MNKALKTMFFYRKLDYLDYRLVQKNIIVGLFSLKLYHNMTDRRTDS